MWHFSIRTISSAVNADATFYVSSFTPTLTSVASRTDLPPQGGDKLEGLFLRGFRDDSLVALGGEKDLVFQLSLFYCFHL